VYSYIRPAVSCASVLGPTSSWLQRRGVSITHCFFFSFFFFLFSFFFFFLDAGVIISTKLTNLFSSQIHQLEICLLRIFKRTLNIMILHPSNTPPPPPPQTPNSSAKKTRMQPPPPPPLRVLTTLSLSLSPVPRSAPTILESKKPSSKRPTTITLSVKAVRNK